ncbi:MAG: tail fiber protein [Bacilli bacterium]|nr:tail fiber protein [Bacilli bacterium]
MLKNKKGFTLIELLAVIVILAIVLAIAIPSVTGIISNATERAFEVDSKMILKQIANEILLDSDFNVSSVTEETIADFDIPNDNYQRLRIGIVDNVPYIIVVGKEKWAGLKAYGDISKTEVVNQDDPIDFGGLLGTIYAMHPSILNNTCNPSGSINSCLSRISLFPYLFIPTGYKICNGAMLSISSYPALYSLIGITYGGDGRSVFALPNLSASIPLTGLNYYMFTASSTIPDWQGNVPTTTSGYDYFPYQYEMQDFLAGEILLASNVDENNGVLLLCDGRILSIEDYPTLYSLIGDTYGGDGTTTFALPDLSSAVVPVDGTQYYMVVNGLTP